MMEFFPGKHAKKLQLLRNQSGLLCQFTPCRILQGFPQLQSAARITPAVIIRPLLQKNLPLCILHNHAGSHHNKRFVPNILP